MHCAVIIPVGPGHDPWISRVVKSVREAWEHNPGPFHSLDIGLSLDLDGLMGQSGARNRGLNLYPADWHFLMDAEDQMCRDTFSLIDLNYAATFGAWMLEGKLQKRNRYPCTRDDLFRYGARFTLYMACFVRGDLGLRFNEDLDVRGCDFDFYLRLPSFIKRPEPLVNVGYNTPSASGPKSAEHVLWWEVVDKVVDQYRQREGGRPALVDTAKG